MNALRRWDRFNLIGALGMAVQLATLALLNHAFRGHYLCASALAIELTLLHNFFWHQRYTWHDRPTTSRPGQLLRFHLSNGLVSMVGNLVLMRLLVDTARLHLLPANVIAIATCSTANFFLSHTWAFAPTKEPAL